MTDENPNHKEAICMMGLKVKEDGTIPGIVATTHPDRVGDILSLDALKQIAEHINTEDASGGKQGSYRGISLFHDWIHQKDPTKDEAGFIIPGSAKVVPLDDGHYGVEVQAKVNEFYKGDMTPEEIKYRIQNGSIAGFSIEYDTDDAHSTNVNHGGKVFRFIKALTEFGGVGFARARMIANPHAVIHYKEIEAKALEEKTMPEQQTQEPAPQTKETAGNEQNDPTPDLKVKEQELEEKRKALETKEAELKNKEAELSKTAELKVKEVFNSQEFKDAIAAELQVKSKTVKQSKEESNMTENVSLSVKEMNEALAKNDTLSFKEAASHYFAEHPEIEAKLQGEGIPLHTSLQVKCDGTKLRIMGQLKTKELQTKDTLDTSTNTTTYTQSIVEFADVYMPGIVDTFNNQTNLFGALRKVPHIEGGANYGWRITTSQQTSLAVDPDDPTVQKKPVSKVKLQTPIKEYRLGVSVSDYTLHHSRASMGDLFMVEVEKTMRDLMKDINKALFAEVADGTGNAILGLEAVADSAGNTTLYGLTRSTANRLAPAAALDTYQAVGGAITSLLLRGAMRKVETEGASRGNLRIIIAPIQRDNVFELEDGNLRYFDNKPSLGFDGVPKYDGVPMIVDPDCNTDAIFVVDFESYYIVISRPPQLIGLAKVGAAEEAYISVYLAAVYEQPRRIHMLDTLS